MSNLKTNYKDAELSPSMNGKRQYELQYNEAGYTNLVDKTAYTEVGDTFGADDINATNSAVNELNQNLTDKTTWKLLGEFGHNISANISNLEYDELLIVFHARTDKYGYGTLNIPKLMLDGTEKMFQSGYYAATSDYTSIVISATTNALKIDSCRYNGSLVTNENMKVFYR